MPVSLGQINRTQKTKKKKKKTTQKKEREREEETGTHLVLMADASFFPGYDDAGVTSVGAEDSVVMASVDGVESGMLAASVGVTVVVAAGAAVVVVVELGMKATA